MQVRDFLHTQPAELTATHGAGHVITASVIHLDDVGATSRTGLDVISWVGINRVRFSISRHTKSFL